MSLESPQAGGICYSCGRALGIYEYGRGDLCPQCRRDTRCCKNCIYFDTAAYNSCHETQADRVVEKDRSNFCDFFKPAVRKSTTEDPAAKAKAAAEALFKKKS